MPLGAGDMSRPTAYIVYRFNSNGEYIKSASRFVERMRPTPVGRILETCPAVKIQRFTVIDTVGDLGWSGVELFRNGSPSGASTG